MLVEDIIDIEKKNSLIYYREEFEATAVYNILEREQKGKISFLIEVNPVGQKQLFIQLIDSPCTKRKNTAFDCHGRPAALAKYRY